MNCEETKGRLDAYHDAELGDAEATSVRDHLQRCAACAAALLDLQSLGEYVRRHGTERAPADLLARTLSRASTASRASTVAHVNQGDRTRLFAWLLPRLAAASIGGLFVGAAWMLATRSEDRAHVSAVVNYFREPARGIAHPLRPEMDRLESLPENRMLAWARQRRRTK